MNRRLLTACALAAVTTSAAGAAAPLSLGPAAIGDTANYRIDFKGKFWNGEPKAFVHDISLTLEPDKVVRAVIVHPEEGQPLQEDVKPAPDGTLEPAEQLSGYDTVARLVHTAPAGFAAGTTWTAPVPVPVPGGGVADIPVTARVAAVDGDAVTIQAAGTGSATGRYASFTMPLDLTIRLAARFDAGRFDRLDYDASEVIHAGPQTQTMTWNYSLVAR
jgi:hypothetical protein